MFQHFSQSWTAHCLAFRAKLNLNATVRPLAWIFVSGSRKRVTRLRDQVTHAKSQPTDRGHRSDRSLVLQSGASEQTGDLARLRQALKVVAELLLKNPVYAPIFQRIEEEIEAEEAALAGRSDLLERARAVLGHKDTGASKSRSMSRDAPSPYRSRVRA